MNNNKIGLSYSEIFLKDYDNLLQKVKERFRVKDARFIDISESKACRVLKGQFDILTLIEMASFVGINVELFYCYRVKPLNCGA